MQYLTDPAWLAVFIGILAVLIPSLVSIWFYLKQKNRKEISYRIISDIPLFVDEKEFKGKLQIFMEGKPLNNAHAVLLRIWNSGNVAIMPSDFADPITLIFKGKTEVMTSIVQSTNPSYLREKVSLRQENRKIIIEPTLLNKGYSIDIALTLNDFDNQIEVGALIAELDELKSLPGNDVYISKIRRISYSIIVLSAFFLLINSVIPYEWIEFPFKNIPRLLITILSIILFISICLYLFFIYLADKMKQRLLTNQ